MGLTKVRIAQLKTVDGSFFKDVKADGYAINLGTDNTTDNIKIGECGEFLVAADTTILESTSGAQLTLKHSDGNTSDFTVNSSGELTITNLQPSSIPDLDASKITSGTIGTSVLGSGTANATTFLRGDGTWAAGGTTPWSSSGSIVYYNGGKVGVNNSSPSGLFSINSGSSVIAFDVRGSLATSSGAAYFFTTNGDPGGISDGVAGNLVVQTRSSANRDIIFACGNTPQEVGRFDGTSKKFKPNLVEVLNTSTPQVVIGYDDSNKSEFSCNSSGELTITNLTTASIPDLDFSKITTGNVPVSRGGTGATAVNDDGIVFGNGGSFSQTSNLLWNGTRIETIGTSKGIAVVGAGSSAEATDAEFGEFTFQNDTIHTISNAKGTGTLRDFRWSTYDGTTLDQIMRLDTSGGLTIESLTINSTPLQPASGGTGATAVNDGEMVFGDNGTFSQTSNLLWDGTKIETIGTSKGIAVVGVGSSTDSTDSEYGIFTFQNDTIHMISGASGTGTVRDFRWSVEDGSTDQIMRLESDGHLSVDSITVDSDFTVDTDSFYVDSTANRVGIRNTDPGYVLEVTGDLASVDSKVGYLGALVINTNATHSAGYAISDAADGSTPFFIERKGSSHSTDPGETEVFCTEGLHLIGNNGGNSINLTNSNNQIYITGGSEKMRLDSNGRLGINESSPDKLLEITDSTSLQLRLSYTSGSLYGDLGSNSSGDLVLESSSGSVNISDSGSCEFNLIPGSSGSTAYVNGYQPSSSPEQALGFTAYSSAGGSISTSDVAFAFYNNTTSLLKILGNARVGINTSGNPNRPLEVADDGRQLRVTHKTSGEYSEIITSSSGSLTFNYTGAYVGFGENGTKQSQIRMWNSNSDQEGIISGDSTYSLKFESKSNSYPIRFDGSYVQFFSNVGLGSGATSPTAPLDVAGTTIRIRDNSTVSTAIATGNKGDIKWDSDYIYICVGTNTWKRASLATW